MELILAFDQQMFLILNHLPHTSWTDMIALAISGVGTAGILWFTIAILLFLREEKKDLPAMASPKAWQAGHWFFLPFFLAGGTSWALVELILKPLVARVRPNELMGAIIVGPASQDFSMPSGHATIAFAMATVLAYKEPKWRWVFFTLAVLISLSRIYLGKHYPLDVIMGGFIGAAIGTLSHMVTNKHVQA